MTALHVEQNTFVAPTGLRPVSPIKQFVIEANSPSPAVHDQEEPAYLLRARTLAETNPSSAIAWARLAQAEQAEDFPERSIAAARSCSSHVDGDDLGAVVAAAKIFLSYDLVEEAEAICLRTHGGTAISLLRAEIAMLSGRHDDALALIGNATTSDELNFVGWIQLTKGDYAKAVNSFRRSLRDGPLSAATLANLGYAHAALGNRVHAIQATEQALSIQPLSKSISLNLLAFLRSNGEFDRARALLGQLRERWPNDLELLFVEAHQWMIIDRVDKALQLLQRTRTSAHWAALGSADSAELAANLAFLRWRSGKLSKAETLAELLHALERSKYKKTEIAKMLIPVARRVSDAGIVDEVIGKLDEATRPDEIRPLLAHKWFLHTDFDRATTAAIEWAESSPFSPSAASLAVFLSVDGREDYETAIRIGRQALKRVSEPGILRNNLAYAFALGGQSEEARAVLGTVESVHEIATSGLISLSEGELALGIELYDRAREVALAEGDLRLAKLVDLNRNISLQRMAGKLTKSESHMVEVTPDDQDFWSDDPMVVLTRRLARRWGIDS